MPDDDDVETLPGDEGSQLPVRRTTRPSLDTLQADQRSMIYDGEYDRVPPLEPVTKGFKNRQQLINWYQAATVRTFGHLTEYMPAADLERDTTLVAALTEHRPHASDDAEWLHTQFIDGIVLPACGTAYRHLRDKSAERTSTTRYANTDEKNWEDIDPEREYHIGMRPGYSRLDIEQASVLDELWGGFDRRGDLSEWMHSLHPATYGTYGATDAQDVLGDDYGVAMMLGDDREARIYRQRFAIGELLPHFAEAARRLRAAEQSETEPDNTWRKA